MIPAGLAKAVAAGSGSDGARPFAVVATAGTTVTSAFDPLDPIADICEAEELWLHVDGCWGGSALFSPRQAGLMHGIERSDSLVWNLHKMMGITQQCTVLLVKDPTQLAPVFSTKANYIFQADKQFGEYDAGDRTFHCGRRVDVLKAWLTWKTFGDAGFAERVDHAVGSGRSHPSNGRCRARRLRRPRSGVVHQRVFRVGAARASGPSILHPCPKTSTAVFTPLRHASRRACNTTAPP